MSVKINPILPKHQPITNYKPTIKPKIADKAKQTNQAINRLAVRFGGEDEVKPPKKTIDDFFKEVKSEQRLDAKFSRKRDVPLYMEPKKSSKNMSLEDYTETFDKALFKKAGYEGKLTKADLKLAGETMRKDGWNWVDWNVEGLRKAQDKPGAMFSYTSESAVEKAKIAGQAVSRLRTYEAETFDKNQAGVENETNQKFVDQGRVIYNSIVNNVEGAINLGIDGILSNGGQKPLVLINPNRPQVNLSGIKLDYQSEMMRRDINGKLDGDGLKRGDFTEGVVTILAPLVVGKVTMPFKAPQTLEKVGAFPNFVVKEGKWNYFFDRGIKPDPHNVPRAIQNKKDLGKLGIFDNSEGRTKMFNLFDQGMRLPAAKEASFSRFGTTVTKQVRVSEAGRIDVKYFYPNGTMNARPQITSIIPIIFEIGGKK
jgi:hypothetical protein